MKLRLMVVLLAILVVVGARSPARSAVRQLSDAEWQRLERREVIFLDELPPGGAALGGLGGTAVALVHAGREAVWRVLVDYPGHVQLYPRVVAATVLEATGERALVRYVVGIGVFSFAFHVENRADRARGRLAWHLARERRNELFRDSWGYWQLETADAGTLLTYGMAARMVLPDFLTRGAERDGLLQTVQAVRDRVEAGR